MEELQKNIEKRLVDEPDAVSVPGAEPAQSFGVDTPGCEETIQRFLEGCLG